MKTRILGMATVLGALWAWAPGCSQPVPECTVGSASAYPYTAKYTMISATDPMGACAGVLGDVIGMQVYSPDDGGKPDTTRKQVAIQSSTMGSLLHSDLSLPGTCPPPNPDGSQDPGDEAVDATIQEPGGNRPYALGDFTSTEPDGSDLCTAPALQMAKLDLPDGVDCADPMTTIDQPVLTETWSNLKVYVTAAALGNQMEADMTFTVDDCSANYHVVGLWPNVGCEELKYMKGITPDPDPMAPAGTVLSCDFCNDPAGCQDCDPAENSETCGDTNTCCDVVNTCKPNGALCDPDPDGEPYNLPFGSGISPDLYEAGAVECDPDLLLCVLTPGITPLD